MRHPDEIDKDALIRAASSIIDAHDEIDRIPHSPTELRLSSKTVQYNQARYNNMTHLLHDAIEEMRRLLGKL